MTETDTRAPATADDRPAGAPRRIRILVADDQPVMRETIADMIGSEPGLSLVATAAGVREAVRLAVAEAPDVAIIDVSMADGGGPRATRDIRRLSPQTQVIAFSAHADADTVFDMLEAGAISYLVKGADPDELELAIRAAASGRRVLSDEVSGSLAGLSSAIDRQSGARLAEPTVMDRSPMPSVARGIGL